MSFSTISGLKELVNSFKLEVVDLNNKLNALEKKNIKLKKEITNSKEKVSKLTLKIQQEVKKDTYRFEEPIPNININVTFL